MRLAVTKDGLVAVIASEPREFFNFTPDQAHTLGRALMKYALKARKIKS